jgi:hypothetical protein
MYKKFKKIKNVGSTSFGQKPLVLHKIDRFSQHGAMTFRITAFGIATLSIMALIIKGFLWHSVYMTFSITDTQHKNTPYSVHLC